MTTDNDAPAAGLVEALGEATFYQCRSCRDFGDGDMNCYEAKEVRVGGKGVICDNCWDDTPPEQRDPSAVRLAALQAPQEAGKIWRNEITHPNHRLLFKRMMEKAGITFDEDDIVSALSKVAALSQPETTPAPSWLGTKIDSMARNCAVAAVDAINGFTMEFAPSPSQHRQAYDTAEGAIWREIDLAIRATPAPSQDAAVVGLPASHTILEQSDMLDGRVSQTVKIMPSGEEYERVVSAEEAYGPGEGE